MSRTKSIAVMPICTTRYVARGTQAPLRPALELKRCKRWRLAIGKGRSRAASLVSDVVAWLFRVGATPEANVSFESI